MKKAFVLLTVVTLCLSMVACGNNNACNHQYEGKITKDATCSEKGVQTFTCVLCNNSYTQEMPTIAHTFGDATVTKEPTCIAEGEKSASCSVCGATNISEPIPKTSHTYDEKVTKVATCTAEGEKTFTCSVCKESYTEVIAAKGHDYIGKTTKKSTCTKDGEKKLTCSGCGDSYTEAITSKGHTWKAATCDQAKHCTSCGKTEGTELGHDYQNGNCVNCGEGCVVTFEQGFPFELTNYYRGTVYATIRFESLSFTVEENGDDTVNINVQFEGVIEQYAGGSSIPYVQFWVHGTGRSNVVGSFMGSIGSKQTSSTITIRNVPIGAYELSVSAINK